MSRLGGAAVGEKGIGGWGQNNGSRSEVKAQELKLGVAELDGLSLSLSLGELEQKQAG